MRASTPPDVRESIRKWMKGVMLQHDWSPNHWARLADTSPTNITRFLKPECTIIPSADTIAKLANAAGSQPDLTALPHAAFTQTRDIPMLDWNALAAGLTSVMSLFPATPNASGEAFAVDCRSDSLDLANVQIGDILTIDPTFARNPKPGSLILARTSGLLALGVHAPPYLMPQSNNPNHPPLLLTKVETLGVVVAITRLL